MKKIRSFYFILGLTIVLVTALIIGIIISNEISNASKGDNFFESDEEADYHVMVILDSSNQIYDESFYEGIREESIKNKIASEIILVDGFEYSERILDMIDMAIYAEVDGIIVNGIESDSLSRKLREASRNSIPVILLNEDMPQSQRITYVGVNRYYIGQSAGVALAKAMSGEGKVAVIQAKPYNQSKRLSEDSMILGLGDVFKNYENLDLEMVRYTETGLLSAETVANQIFNDYPEINGIFCTNSQNAMGIAQAMIDNNLVNRVSLVGYGDGEELLTYIEKGKIAQATLVTDNKEIGRLAINAFYEYKNNQMVSSYLNTVLDTIDQSNIESYLKEMSEADENE